MKKPTFMFTALMSVMAFAGGVNWEKATESQYRAETDAVLSIAATNRHAARKRAGAGVLALGRRKDLPALAAEIDAHGKMTVVHLPSDETGSQMRRYISHGRKRDMAARSRRQRECGNLLGRVADILAITADDIVHPVSDEYL